jgi:hypothetical protein
VRNILIVAVREFKQIIAMRSFWLTLLILPLALAFGPVAQRFLDNDEASRLMIVDRSGGGVGTALAQRIDDEQLRNVLGRLSRYVRRHDLAAAGPGQPWAQHDRYYTDADLAAFRAAGGLPAALARIEAVKPSGVPEFKAPEPPYAVVATPPALAAASPAAVDAAAQPLLRPADKAAKAVDTILFIPADFARTGQARLLANSDPSPRLMGMVQDVLTRELRTGFLQSQGLSPQAAAAAAQIAPALAVSTPPPGGGLKEAMMVRSVLPGGVALTVLTFVPIWMPFTVLARLGAGIPTWQVLLAGAILLGWTALQLAMLGRLFRHSLLATGQKASLKTLMERMRPRDA